MHALHQPGVVQLGEVAANGVFGNGEVLAQLGGHDLAVAFEDQEDFLPAQGREFGDRMIVHGFACLCL